MVSEERRMTQSPNCIPPRNPLYIITCTFMLIAAWETSYCTCFTPQINHLVISIWVDQSVTGTFTLPINIFMTFQSLIHFITLNFQAWPRKPWISAILCGLCVFHFKPVHGQGVYLRESRKLTWTPLVEWETPTGKWPPAVGRTGKPLVSVMSHETPSHCKCWNTNNNMQVRYIYLKRTHFTQYKLN